MVSAEKLEAQRRPEQPPPKPSKLDPGLAALLSLTGVPLAISIAQVPGQSMPVGDETMRPLPLPTICTESVTVLGGAGAKLPPSGDPPPEPLPLSSGRLEPPPHATAISTAPTSPSLRMRPPRERWVVHERSGNRCLRTP